MSSVSPDTEDGIDKNACRGLDEGSTIAWRGCRSSTHEGDKYLVSMEGSQMKGLVMPFLQGQSLQ